jgi:diadenylate cyclase
MNRINNACVLSEETAINKQLEKLKSRVTQLHNDISCLEQCSRLSSLLQRIYEIREGINQLEQNLLQSHLKYCISPSLKVPGEVVLSVSKSSGRRHGAIMAMEHEDNLDKHLQGGVVIDASVSAPILEHLLSWKLTSRWGCDY